MLREVRKIPQNDEKKKMKKKWTKRSNWSTDLSDDDLSYRHEERPSPNLVMNYK